MCCVVEVSLKAPRRVQKALYVEGEERGESKVVKPTV